MNELLEKAKAGDIEAFGKLIISIETDLERIAQRRLVDKSYVHDVLQNVFYKAYININTLEDNKKFKSWILTILKNECINTNTSIIRRREVSLYDFNENLEDSKSYNPESNISFEQMISKLSDDEKRLLRMKFQDNFSHTEIAEDLGIPYNTVKSKINRAIKKITLILLVLILLSGFTVLATFIIKQIRAHFTTSLNAINTAVENNYVQEIDSDFVYDNGIGIKVDAIVLDDKNLDISFVYDVQDKEKYGEITGIRLEEYVIKSGNLILTSSNEKLQEPIKITKQEAEKFEQVEGKYRNSILFSTIEKFPNINSIDITISTVYINSNKKKFYKISGNWDLKHDIIDKFNEREKKIYLMVDNKYATNANVILTDTSIKFDILFNVELKNSDVFKKYLHNENDNFECVESYLSDDQKHLKAVFDISKYNDNIDELTLEIPRENDEKIIIKFRRNL